MLISSSNINVKCVIEELQIFKNRVFDTFSKGSEGMCVFLLVSFEGLNVGFSR